MLTWLLDTQMGGDWGTLRYLADCLSIMDVGKGLLMLIRYVWSVEKPLTDSKSSYKV